LISKELSIKKVKILGSISFYSVFKKNYLSSIAFYFNKRCYVDFQDFQINFQSPAAVDCLGIYKKEILMIGDDQEVDIGGDKIYTFRHIYSKLGNTANRHNLKSIEPGYILPKLSLS
jgi:hypothetical protein